MSPLRQNLTFESIEDWSNVDSMKMKEKLLQLGLNMIFEYVFTVTFSGAQKQRKTIHNFKAKVLALLHGFPWSSWPFTISKKPVSSWK